MVVTVETYVVIFFPHEWVVNWPALRTRPRTEGVGLTHGCGICLKTSPVSKMCQFWRPHPVLHGVSCKADRKLRIWEKSTLQQLPLTVDLGVVSRLESSADSLAYYVESLQSLSGVCAVHLLTLTRSKTQRPRHKKIIVICMRISVQPKEM